MKKKLLILFVSLVALLFVGHIVFADEYYTRTPADTEFYGSVIFTAKDIASYYGCEGYASWNLTVRGYPDYDYPYTSECQNELDGDFIFTTTLPVGSYSGVRYSCYNEPNCEDMGENAWFEEGEPAFTVLETPAIPFIDISDNFVSSTLAYIGNSVSGLGPLLYVLAGIPLAFWCMRKVMSLIPKK
jgi:hypothetical protein